MLLRREGIDGDYYSDNYVIDVFHSVGKSCEVPILRWAIAAPRS